MGIGIATMHYIGMFAMQTAATISYNPGWFLLSVVIAVAVSLVALRFSLKFSQQTSSTANKMPMIITAIIMGAAILLMHYTGMAAATFKPVSELPVERASSDNIGLVVIVTVITFIVLTVAQLLSIEASARTDES